MRGNRCKTRLISFFYRSTFDRGLKRKKTSKSKMPDTLCKYNEWVCATTIQKTELCCDINYGRLFAST